MCLPAGRIKQRLALFRFLGLVHYVSFACDALTYPSPIATWIWPEYLSPFVIFGFYLVVAAQVASTNELGEYILLRQLARSRTYYLPEDKERLIRDREDPMVCRLFSDADQMF